MYNIIQSWIQHEHLNLMSKFILNLVLFLQWTFCQIWCGYVDFLSNFLCVFCRISYAFSVKCPGVLCIFHRMSYEFSVICNIYFIWYCYVASHVASLFAVASCRVSRSPPLQSRPKNSPFWAGTLLPVLLRLLLIALRFLRRPPPPSRKFPAHQNSK